MARFVRMFSLLLVLVTSTTSAQTGWMAEVQTVDFGNPYGWAYTTHEFKNSPISTWSFVGVSKTWGEILGGASYNWSRGEDITSVGIGAGFEQPTWGFRAGATLLTTFGKTTAFVFLELGRGDDNWWYLTTIDREVWNNVRLGVTAQRTVGIGPRAEFAFGPVSVWEALVWDPERDWGMGVFAGIRTTF